MDVEPVHRREGELARMLLGEGLPLLGVGPISQRQRQSLLSLQAFFASHILRYGSPSVRREIGIITSLL